MDLRFGKMSNSLGSFVLNEQKSIVIYVQLEVDYSSAVHVRVFLVRKIEMGQIDPNVT